MKYIDSLITKCLEIVVSDKSEPHTIVRALSLVKQMIYQSERKGTGNNVPHNALLKGELIKRIVVKDRDLHRDIILTLHNNTTIWEFKKRIGEQMAMIPKYLKLEKGAGANAKRVTNVENGKTLTDYGIKNGDIFFASRDDSAVEELPPEPLVDDNKQFTEKASTVFNDWFTEYSNDDDKMTKESCGLFIRGVTSEPPKLHDDRVEGLFKEHDKNQDGFIEREDFLEFYRDAAVKRDHIVRDNLRHNNIRIDLTRLIDVVEDNDYADEEMPRYRLSQDEKNFDLIMSLLSKKDESVSKAAWDLI